MGRTIIEVKVADAEKRRFPSKHYVYVIHVHWSDNTSYVIYRRYSRFFDFQIRLLEMYPEEAGSKDPQQRSIPFLPGKKLLSRSNIRKVAMERLVALDEYCQTLIRLPAKISESQFVLSFFETQPEDVNPKESKQDEGTMKRDSYIAISEPVQLQSYVAIADYKKQKRNELNLQGGDIVEVIEKNHTGWWFVSVEDEQGWVPATFLQMNDEENNDDFKNVDTGKDPEKYVSINSYTAQNPDELTFEKGIIVEVLKKNLDGWWFVRYQSKEGWAPATYLHQVFQDNVIESKKPVETISNVMELSKPKETQSVETKKTVPNYSLNVPGSDQQTVTRSPLFKHKPPPRRGTFKRTHSGKGSSKEKSEYFTIADFSASMTDGVSFKKGDRVKVMEKAEGGWWYVNIDNKEGWAPSNFIEKKSTKKPQPAISSMKESDAKPDRPLTPNIEIQTTKPVEPKQTVTTAVNKPVPPSKPDSVSKTSKPLPPRKPDIKQASKPTDGNITSELQQAFAALKPVKSVAKEEMKSVATETPKAALKPVELVPKEEMKSVSMATPKAFKPRVPSTRPVLPPTIKQQTRPPRPPPPSVKPNNNLYTVLADYANDEEEGALTLSEGMVVEIIEREDSGWCLVETTDKIQGWAPTSYLTKQ